jgi:hypothetical protein
MKYSTARSVRLNSARRGRIGAILLAVLTITFVCGILVVNSFFVAQIRVQQENATDAAALAAAEVLAQEDFLYGEPTLYVVKQDVTSGLAFPIFRNAAQAAIDFAAKNYVNGKRFELRGEDIEFHCTDVQARTSRGSMAAVDPPESALTLAQKRGLNSVQVTGHHTTSRGNAVPLPILGGISWEMSTRSEAVLDGYIYGFHADPLGEVNIPLAPIGLNARSWMEQVEAPVDRTLATPAKGRLPFGDFKVMLGAIAQDPDYHDCTKIAPMIHVGTTTLAQSAMQLSPHNPGITPAHHQAHLKANNNLPFALDPTTLQLPLSAAPHANQDNGGIGPMEANLLGLKNKNTRLIWPLISGYNNSAKEQRKAVITGFVAARVINVKRVSYHLLTDKNGDTVPGSKKQGSGEEGTDDKGLTRHQYEILELTLHPTLLATSTAMVFVRDWPMGEQHQFRFPNAYVKTIRLLK